MKERVCLITGATRGIGRAAALAFAELGYSLVVLCRSEQRGRQLVADVQRVNKLARVELLMADLSSLDQVRQAATDFMASGRSLDLLINNAGVLHTRRELSQDGFEMMWAVNHLAHYLLTRLVLERLRESAPARIVGVSSLGHALCRQIRYEDPDFEQGRFSALRAYGQSKLANILFARELTRRLNDSGVTANSIHPGLVYTNLALQHGGFLKWITPLTRWLFKTPAQGAQTVIHAATAPELKGRSGIYLSNCRETEPRAPAKDDQAASRLWDLSARLTGLEP